MVINHHNHKINPGQFDDPTCGSCGLLVDETAQHVLSECPQFLYERNNAFQKYEDMDLICQTDSNLSGNRPSKTCNPSTNNTPNCGEDLQLSIPHGTEKNTVFASAERNCGNEDREGIG